MDIVIAFLEFINDKDLSIPLGEVITFVFINSLCLLSGRFKLGLLISYCFVFYWGFLFNKDYFVDILGNSSMGLYIYALSGFAMIIIALIGFFVED
ncbi:MAG: hypothetical protein HY097_05870 [Nitrospinae bacterium]|nr:hypothetical protein [Nitrospinota bacterium]MBI3813743.1 hypothetical protein [Nitrospinota bacterium]